MAESDARRGRHNGPGPGTGASTYVGYHAVFEVLRRGPVEGTVYLAATNRKARDIEAEARSRGVDVVHVERERLKELGGEQARGAVLHGRVAPDSAVKTLDGFLATLKVPEALVIVLDGVTDPHNVGAIIRSADQFEADLVIVRERRAAGDTSTLSRTSAGATAYVNRITVTNIEAALRRLQEAAFWVYGASADGKPIGEIDLSGRTALVLGDEGSGLSPVVRRRCDDLVAIPAGGNVDSLNVSVAAGILMYEVRRSTGWKTAPRSGRLREA
ncbi:MAG: 23S rRNA (guanosine(2251)-2'-O)-methyltransferase RlmB [Spirochaetaceae bacterium]